MATLELSQVVKTFDKTTTIHGVDLQIADGEFVVFVGPSGCGKSTLLRIISGLETATSGEIRIDGKRVNEVTAAHRGCSMVFQSYALYPHMSVYDKVVRTTIGDAKAPCRGRHRTISGQQGRQLRQRAGRAGCT